MGQMASTCTQFFGNVFEYKRLLTPRKANEHLGTSHDEHARKRRYYDTPDVVDWVKRKFESENMPLVLTVALSWHGVWAPESAAMLRRRGQSSSADLASQADLRLITVMVVEKTALIFRGSLSDLRTTHRHQWKVLSQLQTRAASQLGRTAGRLRRDASLG